MGKTGRSHTVMALVALGLILAACSSGGISKAGQGSSRKADSSPTGSANTSQVHDSGCPLTAAQVSTALGSSEVEQTPTLSQICLFGGRVSGSYGISGPVVTFQKWPGPDSQSLGYNTLADICGLAQQSNDTIVNEPSWGSGAFLSISTAATESGDDTVDAWFGHYDLDLLLPPTLANQASSIVSQLVPEVLQGLGISQAPGVGSSTGCMSNSGSTGSSGNSGN
jgi:hypothetical protein